jgi:hypothetical protein
MRSLGCGIRYVVSWMLSAMPTSFPTRYVAFYFPRILIIMIVPKPKATIKTVENTPSVLMESALPTSKPVANMLAPEEVFFTSTSLLKAPSELTPTEKHARRTKQRKLRKRQRDILEKDVNKLAKPKGTVGSRKRSKLR